MNDVMTSEEYLKLTEKKSKYNNQKVKCDGYTFDSIAEYEHYLGLRQRVTDGAITRLRVHPPFDLTPTFRRNGKTIQKIVYKADFAFFDVEKAIDITQDVKGVRTAVFNLKYKLLMWRFPDLNYEIIDVQRKKRGKKRK